MVDIARATNLRVEDATLTMNELGFLTRRFSRNEETIMIREGCKRVFNELGYERTVYYWTIANCGKFADSLLSRSADQFFIVPKISRHATFSLLEFL